MNTKLSRFLLIALIVVLLAILLVAPLNASFAQSTSTPTPTIQCQFFDFTSTNGGFVVFVNSNDTSPQSARGVWTNGQGWLPGGSITQAGGTYLGVYIHRSFTAFVVTSVSLTYDKTIGTLDNGTDPSTTISLLQGGSYTNLSTYVDTVGGTGLVLNWSGSLSGADILLTSLASGNLVANGYTALISVQVCGYNNTLFTPSATPTNTATPTFTVTPTNPCVGGFCVGTAVYQPQCTITPVTTYTPTSTLQGVANTAIFPTVPTSQIRVFVTATGTSPTATRTPTGTITPGNTPTPTATVPCVSIPNNVQIATFSGEDLPGGSCYRLLPGVNLHFDPLVLFGYTIVPSVAIQAHPLDFCYTTFRLNALFGVTNLWTWVQVVFGLFLVGWIITLLRSEG